MGGMSGSVDYELIRMGPAQDDDPPCEAAIRRIMSQRIERKSESKKIEATIRLLNEYSFLCLPFLAFFMGGGGGHGRSWRHNTRGATP